MAIRDISAFPKTANQDMGGITLRQYLIGQALTGLSHRIDEAEPTEIAIDAIALADEVIRQLEAEI